MGHIIIPCVEGDDEFIADKLNAVTDSKIDFEDTIEDDLVVFKVTDSDGNIIAGCNLLINCWKVCCCGRISSREAIMFYHFIHGFYSILAEYFM